MANIKLVRIDSRLIHGQVVTKWLKVSNARRIIIIDNELSEDPFMSDIYMLAAPQGIAVDVYSVETAVTKYKEKQLGKEDILVLFKNVANCYESFKAGFPIDYLQIGGIASAPGRTNVYRAVSLDSTDVTQLKEMQEQGTEIYIHIIPEESKVRFDKTINKVNL
ncbi:PTS sugar transporter subunit IIB [Bacillus sp. PK3-056]|uniref:PTS sugar transporter subunit IIB n=1 Tax=Niallia circulans TaxID=1397 RepID=UPI0002F18C39|nr:PTS sugar transporter subunit IIB [Niallia circulans]AYV72661.1 PTS sugar transporter [Niallia circulans]